MSTGSEEREDRQIRCRLPDSIIGIGHAGKQVVYHYLSQDWILEEGVAARENDFNPNGFSAYVVDTATDEQKSDERTIKRMNERVKRIAEDSGRQPEVVKTEATYINPLDHAPDDLISRAGLTSESTVGRIGNHANLRAWWLEDNDSMLTNGYSEGVLRRRGLSKALLHASQTGGGPLNELPRQVGDTTTIIVGIGGGTGSGMFIDLAKQIQNEGGTVNLFVTIPGLDEKDRRRANAYAALSELEYLALRNRNPFQNIILVPFGPAQELQNRDTFLDGVVQAIVARENTTNDFVEFLDESAPNPRPELYAPFTIAVPQILRYDVGDIQQTADALNSYREAKRDALNDELALYDRLQTFFIEKWKDDEIGEHLKKVQQHRRVNDDQFTLSSDEASALYNRLNELETWLNDDDRFGYVDNQALETWRDQLSGWISGMEDTSGGAPDRQFKKELATRLPERVESLRSVEELYPGEESEQELDSVFRDELRAIKMRANVLRAGKLIDESEVTEALNAALDEDRDGWVGAQRLEDRMGEYERRVQEYEHNIELLDDLLEDLRTRMESRKKRWWENVRDDVEVLMNIERHGSELQTRLEELEQSMRDAVRVINNAHDPDDVPSNLLDFDFDRLNDKLESIGLETVDEEAIKLSVERTADAYRIWYEINDGGLLSSLIGNDDEEKNTYRKYLDDVDDRYIVVQPTGERDDFDRDFVCEFAAEGRFDSLVEEFQEKRERTLDRIIYEFEEAITTFDPADRVAETRAEWIGEDFDLTWPGDYAEYPDRLRNKIVDELDANSPAAVYKRLDTGEEEFEETSILKEAFSSAFLGPVESKRAELREARDEAMATADRYDELRRIVSDLGDNFDGTGPDRPKMEDLPSTSREENPYVRKTKSIDQSGLRQHEDIAESGIWQRDESQEFAKIRTHFEQFAQTVGRNTSLLGLAERRIEVATGDGAGHYRDVATPVYDGHYVGNVFMGRPFETDENPANPVFKSVRDQLEDSNLFFREGQNGYSHEAVGFGAPWDLSMVTFVGGVFLDNLRQVQQVSKGYKRSYESQRDELREDVRIRHTHAVDGNDFDICDTNAGAFVYRDRLIDLNSPDDRYMLLDSTEGELVDRLLDEYVEWDTFESSIDLEQAKR